MQKALKEFFTPPVFERDEEKTRVAGLLYRALIATYILLPTAVVVQFVNPSIGRFYLPLAAVLFLAATILLVITRSGYVRAASIALILVLLVLSTIVDLLANGETRPVSIFAGAVIVAGGLLLGPRGSLIAAILYSVKHAVVLALVHNDLVRLTGSPPPTPLMDAFVSTIGYLMIAFVFSIASTSIYSTLTRARESEKQVTASNRRLQVLTQNLEGYISDRTADLETGRVASEKRARQFEAITRVSRAISTTRNLQELLPRISRVISEQFGFYHTGIFLVDASNTFAVLRAANSAGGQIMLARGHQLKIGQQGIVGYVTGSGNPRVVLDVAGDPIHFRNPDLPDTRSEMALPLVSAGQVIGALDVQSTEANAFASEDIEVLSALADQVSLAIQNARLFEETQRLLNEAEAVHRQYLRETWSRLPQEQRLVGFRYSGIGAEPIEEGVSEKKDKARNANGDEQKREISVPVVLRGEKIGELAVQIPKEGRLKSDQMDLIRAVAERVALSIENARLFEETTRRAERERLVSDITTKIRGTNDPQDMIRTAMEELQRALGATKVEIIPQKSSLDSDK